MTNTSMVNYTPLERTIPTWMQRARQNTERGSILVLIAGILLILPLFFPQELPRTSNYEHYLYRVENYATALREGRLYPRWTPNALYGYGAPIAHFSPPLPAYLPALVQVALTGDANTALHIIAGVMLIASSLFTYYWLLRRMGVLAGLLGALLYLYSPYIGLTALHLQGDMRAVLICALLPAWLWSIDRYSVRGRSSSFVLMVVFFASLMLTQPEAAVLALFISAIVISFAPLNRLQRPILPVAGACLLGVCVSACFWLPAALEAGLVRFVPSQSISTLSLTGLLTPPSLFDGNVLNPPPQFGFGLPQLLCGAAGLAAIYYFRKWRTLPTIMAGLLLILTLIALLVLPEESWLLIPCSLCLAVIGSATTWWTERTPYPSIAICAVLIGIVALSAPVWLSPAFSRNTVPIPTPVSEIELERRGLGVATLPDFEALPNPLPSSILPDQELLNGYASGNILKVSVSQNPAGVVVGLIAHHSHSDRMQIFANASADLHILTSYFPGWTATFNGNEVPLTTDSSGLIVATIPGGNGELTLNFGSTTARTLSWIVTWLSIVVTGIVAYRLRAHTETSREFAVSLGRRRLLTLSVALLLVSVIGSALFLISRPASEESLATAARMPESARAVSFRTQAGLELTGYESYPTDIPSGGLLGLTLYWHALRFLPETYLVSTQIVNLESGETVVSSPPDHPGELPTQRWTTQGYVTDTYQLFIPQDTAPGSYEIRVEIFACTSNCSPTNRLNVFDADGVLAGYQIALPLNIRET